MLLGAGSELGSLDTLLLHSLCCVLAFEDAALSSLLLQYCRPLLAPCCPATMDASSWHHKPE